MKRKILSVVLAAAMVMSVAACGNDANPGSNPSGSGSEPSGSTPDSGNQATPEPVAATPEVDNRTPGEKLADEYYGFVETPMNLNGRVITLVTQPATRYAMAKDAAGNDDPEHTPEASQEIVRILKEIEKDYNCTINVEIVKGSKVVEAMQSDFAAGDVKYDILDYGVSDTYVDQLVGNGLIMDMNDPAIADIIKFGTNPWSKQSDYGNFNGTQYAVQFDTNNTSNILRNALLFNVDLARDLLGDEGDIYSYVKNGTWTWEKFEELCAKIVQNRPSDDIVPAAYGKENLMFPMVVFSNNGKIADVRDGKLTYTMNEDNALAAANWIVNLMDKGYLAHNAKEEKKDEYTPQNDYQMAQFTAGQAVFFFDFYGDLQKYANGTETTDYIMGVVPHPLGPAAVAAGDTYHGVTYSVDLKMIAAGTEKPEEVAAVLVAIANRCLKHDIENTELKVSLMDEGSKDMVMLMYNNMRSDLSRRVKGVGIGGANKEVLRGAKTPAQAYGELAGKEQALYDENINK